MGKLSLSGNNIMVRTGIFRTVTLPIDSLRLLFLIKPPGWTSDSFDIINLDSLSSDHGDEEFSKWKERLNEKNFFSKTKLVLADYIQPPVTISMRDVRSAQFDFIERLLAFRPERLRKLREWLSANPQVVLVKGQLGMGKVVLDKDGYHKGKKKNLDWINVKQIQVIDRHFGNGTVCVIPHGVSSGQFGVKKYRYSFSIRMRNQFKCLAELTFWRLLVLGAAIGQK